MINVDVAGDAEVAAAFNKAGSWIRERLKRTVDREGEILRLGETDRLSGAAGPKRRRGDPLGVGATLATRTGKLRGSVVAKAFESGQTYAVRVYPTASRAGYRYGFALGTGAHLTVGVGSYSRSVSRRDRYSTANVSSTGKVKMKKLSSGVEFVKAARRRVNLNRRSFGPATLSIRREEISARMQGEVNQAGKELQSQINGAGTGEGI